MASGLQGYIVRQEYIITREIQHCMCSYNFHALLGLKSVLCYFSWSYLVIFLIAMHAAVSRGGSRICRGEGSQHGILEIIGYQFCLVLKYHTCKLKVLSRIYKICT